MTRNIAEDGSWRYTNAHEQYPVQANEVWCVGEHTFVCGDLQAPNRLQETLLQVEAEQGPTSLIYTDPPWNAGNAASFRTKAGVTKRQVDMNDLLTAVLEPARSRGLLAFMEGGVKQQAMVNGLVKSLGGYVGDNWDITYYKKKPCFILAADFRDEPVNDYPDLTGLDDDDTPRAVLEHYASAFGGSKLVVDPCGGRGLTTRTAAQCGWKAVTSELSPYRMAEAIDSVVKTIKQTTGETVIPERKS